MTLEGSRCPSCGRVSVPSEPTCLICEGETDACDVPGEGEVLAWTRPAPDRVVALVALTGGARVLATAHGDRAVRVGDAVTVVSTEGAFALRTAR